MARCEEAEQEYKKAIELEPEDGRFHALLGVILSSMGRDEEVEEELRKAVELEPRNKYLNFMHYLMNIKK